jgi:hypothetical protein
MCEYDYLGLSNLIGTTSLVLFITLFCVPQDLFTDYAGKYLY